MNIADVWKTKLGRKGYLPAYEGGEKIECLNHEGCPCDYHTATKRLTEPFLPRRKPLDYPGTEAYFNALWREARRETAIAIPRSKPTPKVKAKRTGPNQIFPQCCVGCAVELLPEMKAFACPEFPVAWCMDCHAKSAYRLTHPARRGAKFNHDCEANAQLVDIVPIPTP